MSGSTSAPREVFYTLYSTKAEGIVLGLSIGRAINRTLTSKFRR